MVKGGALGFKAFMSPSGIDDFPHVAPNDVAAALPTIRALGVPLLVHAELVDGDVPKGVSLLREGDGQKGNMPRDVRLPLVWWSSLAGLLHPEAASRAAQASALHPLPMPGSNHPLRPFPLRAGQPA